MFSFTAIEVINLLCTSCLYGMTFDLCHWFRQKEKKILFFRVKKSNKNLKLSPKWTLVLRYNSFYSFNLTLCGDCYRPQLLNFFIFFFYKHVSDTWKKEERKVDNSFFQNFTHTHHLPCLEKSKPAHRVCARVKGERAATTFFFLRDPSDRQRARAFESQWS